MRQNSLDKYGYGPVPLEAFLDAGPPAPTSAPEVAAAPRDIAVEMAAEIAAMQVPAEMLSAIIRAYTVALLKQPQAETAEGRGKVLQALRELVMNAILDGVKEVRGPHRAG